MLPKNRLNNLWVLLRLFMTWYGLMNNYPCETFNSNTMKIQFKAKNYLLQIQFGHLGFPLFRSGQKFWSGHGLFYIDLK